MVSTKYVTFTVPGMSLKPLKYHANLANLPLQPVRLEEDIPEDHLYWDWKQKKIINSPNEVELTLQEYVDVVGLPKLQV